MFVFFARSLAEHLQKSTYSIGKHVIIDISLILFLFDTVLDRGNCKHSAFEQDDSGQSGLQIMLLLRTFYGLFNNVCLKETVFICVCIDLYSLACEHL